MKRIILMVVVAFCLTITLQAQTALKKVYDEGINPLEQVEKAVKQAQVAGKHVVCQVGGNWCPWCLRFADFITKDSVINRMIADNYVYIHVNYNPRKKVSESAQAQAKQLMKRLGIPSSTALFRMARSTLRCFAMELGDRVVSGFLLFVRVCR